MSTLIQFRRDTAANWTSNNPTLSSGEIGYETDTGKLKIGTGNTAWTSLAYGPKIGAGADVLDSTIASSLVISPYGLYNTMEIKTSGTSWSVPAALQTVGAKWKVTLVGGGGGGGGSGTASGSTGGGGGSGAVVIGFYTYVSGQNTMTYVIGALGSGGSNAPGNGAAGTSTTTTYNAVTYTAGFGGGGGALGASGAGGSGGTATGGTLNLAGNPGDSGGLMAATSNYQGNGAESPLRLGYGGRMSGTATGADGVAGSGYGSGGSGGRTGNNTTTAYAGGDGTAGVLIIQY